MKTINDVKEAFAEADLLNLFDEVQKYAKNSIVIELDAEADSDAIGASRVGGDPDLPAEQEWFTNPDNGEPLNFVAQINCAEISDFDTDKKLPEKGILYFFYDLEAFNWGFDPKDGAGSRVYYYDGSMAQLERKPCPEGIRRFEPSALTFSSQISLPEYSSQLVETSLSEDEYERYLDVVDELELDGEHKLLGHSNNIQNGMELQCELVRNGIYCGTASAYNDPRVAELAAGRFDWQLLFQIASYDEDSMQWGDDGRLYFWIRSEDLENKDFDKAWQILQSY